MLKTTELVALKCLKSTRQMLKKQTQTSKNDILTSFQVVGRKNDWKIVYVSNLANKIFSG